MPTTRASSLREEPLVARVELRSSVRFGEPGFALVHAVILTLDELGLLESLEVTAVAPEWKGFSPVVSKAKLPFLQVGKQGWDKVDQAYISEVYRTVGASRVTREATLSAWIRALVPDASGVWDYYSRCPRPEILASLVERGGDVLSALRSTAVFTS